jgi:hypothetical protein
LLGLEGGQHRGVADRLDQSDGCVDDFRGERLQANRLAGELTGWDLLPEAGEADEIGEANGDLA